MKIPEINTIIKRPNVVAIVEKHNGISCGDCILWKVSSQAICIRFHRRYKQWLCGMYKTRVIFKKT